MLKEALSAMMKAYSQSNNSQLIYSPTDAPKPESNVVGIGISFTVSQKSPLRVKIIRVMPNGPASKADLKIDDEIIDIDGTKMSSLSNIQDVTDKIRGQENTKICITVSRDSKEKQYV